MKLHLAAILLPALAQAEVSIDYTQVGSEVSFVPDLTTATGTAPYTFLWTFGDDEQTSTTTQKTVGDNSELGFTISTDQNATHTYPIDAPATYGVTLVVADTEGNKESATTTIEVDHYEYKPKSAGSIRIAQFNSGFADGAENTEGRLAELLKYPTWDYAKKIADVIQKNQPDMLSLQEFDHYWSTSDKGDNFKWDSNATKSMVDDFQTNFLAIPQAEGNMAITYPHFFVAPCNTGVQTGFDANNDGKIDGGDVSCSIFTP
jgi:PKD repeat protein